MNKIRAYFDNHTCANAFHILDEKTCVDLDFDALFAKVDYTKSRVGQQYLYYLMRTSAFQPKESELNERLVQHLSTAPDSLFTVQSQLAKLGENAYDIAALFQGTHRKSPKFLGLMRYLPFVSGFLLIMLFFSQLAWLLLLPVLLLNSILHYWNKRVLMVYIHSIPELLKLLKISRVFEKDQHFHLVNKNISRPLDALGRFKFKLSLFSADAHLEGDMYVLVWTIYEFIKILFLIEPLALYSVLRSLEDHQEDIEEVYAFVGRIDALQSTAILRSEMEYFCIPDIRVDNVGLHFTAMQHPLIDHCVGNSIDASSRSVLLTGSNMSGKTSFIKAIALNVICALSLNTCFAETFTMPYMKVYSAIRINDDLLNDKSYYQEEVQRIAYMIERSKEPVANLFILDEIFKGTNTIERIASGKAVLSYLSSAKNTVFVSTHDVELADLLQGDYDLYHFSETVDNNCIGFDYKLKTGKLNNTNAIRILELNNYPKELIAEALDISHQLSHKTIL